jgi:hypothetical protein
MARNQQLGKNVNIIPTFNNPEVTIPKNNTNRIGNFWQNNKREFQMKKSRFTEHQIIKILEEAESDVPMPNLSRQLVLLIVLE